MHFYWEDFDSIISRVLRSLAPPLINLVVIFFLLIDGLKSMAAWSLEKLGEQTRGDAAQSYLGELATLLSEVTVSGSFEAIKGLEWGKLTEAANSALSALIAVLLAFILFAYILDFAVRLLRFASPLKAEAEERLLVQHASLDQAFEDASLAATPIPKSQRYYRWLAIRIQLESSAPQGTYFTVRRRLEEAATLNERMFSYIAPYTLLSFWAIAQASKGNSLGLMVLFAVVVAGFVLLRRQFQLSRDIVKNDLEAFVASKGGAIPTADGLISDTEWWRVFTMKPWALKLARGLRSCFDRLMSS